jgi:hypothetical protein
MGVTKQQTIVYTKYLTLPLEAALPSLTKRYEPVFTGLAVVKISLRLVTYQHTGLRIAYSHTFRFALASPDDVRLNLQAGLIFDGLR